MSPTVPSTDAHPASTELHAPYFIESATGAADSPINNGLSY